MKATIAGTSYGQHWANRTLICLGRRATSVWSGFCCPSALCFKCGSVWEHLVLFSCRWPRCSIWVCTLLEMPPYLYDTSHLFIYTFMQSPWAGHFYVLWNTWQTGRNDPYTVYNFFWLRSRVFNSSSLCFIGMTLFTYSLKPGVLHAIVLVPLFFSHLTFPSEWPQALFITCSLLTWK